MMVIQFSDIWTHVPWTVNHSDSAFSRWAWVSWSTVGFLPPLLLKGNLHGLVARFFRWLDILPVTQRAVSSHWQKRKALTPTRVAWPRLILFCPLPDSWWMGSYYLHTTSRMPVPHWLWQPYGIGQAIIFLPCYFHLSSIFFSSPNLSGQRLDVYHTSTHGVALVRI